ncbi:ANR family transcriptional regulator [Candidatus Pantoea formicae]|uniref:ANR family transcriptional regulator n=1 Tax=Candidatus Pantoea formicae TaxID=2608355 RepID=UPI003ED8489D
MAIFITEEMLGKPCSPFLKHASHAVMFERDGKFAEAVMSWEAAAPHADKDIDRVWADDRRAFCNSALARGWGQQYAGI